MIGYIVKKMLRDGGFRYEKNIDLLTMGRFSTIKRTVLDNFIKEGIKVLDVGCGTGRFLVRAVDRGAICTGIDASSCMLKEAQRKLELRGVTHQAVLKQADIIEMPLLFEDNSFDLVYCGLVMSELYYDLRRFLLKEALRILKPGGTLVIMDEVEPVTPLEKMGRMISRMPFALIGYLGSGIFSRPLRDLEAEVLSSGFAHVGETREMMNSLAVISAEKEEGAVLSQLAPLSLPLKNDISPLKDMIDYTARWMPNEAEPGLRIIGDPDEKSPVMVMGNYHLAVRRVERALQGLNVYLLVAPTYGVDPHVTGAGHHLDNRTISYVLKTSGIEDMVEHRRLIIPQMAAPNVDLKELKEKTGWEGEFGPANIGDLFLYFKLGMKLVPEDSHFNYGTDFRLEMMFSMNFLAWMAVSTGIALFSPGAVLPFSSIFWGSAKNLYLFYENIPGKCGWSKALALGLIESFGLAVYSAFKGEPWWKHWKWMLTMLGVNAFLGLDLSANIGKVSQLKGLLRKLPIKRLGPFYNYDRKFGPIHLYLYRCIGCGMCERVCPKYVFEMDPQKKKVRLARPQDCISCGGCVKQCPANALDIW